MLKGYDGRDKEEEREVMWLELTWAQSWYYLLDSQIHPQKSIPYSKNFRHKKQNEEEELKLLELIYVQS